MQFNVVCLCVQHLNSFFSLLVQYIFHDTHFPKKVIIIFFYALFIMCNI